jgi:electron transfer flavoprotein alpha subunit
VLVEHNDEKLSPVTLNAVTAAKQLGNDVHLLVAGKNAEAVSKLAANIPNVKAVSFVQVFLHLF